MKTLRMIVVGLVVAAVMSITGCTLVGASIETSGYGVTLKANVAGFSTETGFELPGTEEDE